MRNSEQKPETDEERLAYAKKVFGNVAKTSKSLDEAIAAAGRFAEELIEKELLTERVREELRNERGIHPPEENPLNLPNSIDDRTIDNFQKHMQTVMEAPASAGPLRDAALFLLQLSNSLIFERGLVDNQAEFFRRKYYELLTEFVKYDKEVNKRKFANLRI